MLFPLRPFGTIMVADPRDVACMKVAAIASRGARGEFANLSAAEVRGRTALTAIVRLFTDRRFGPHWELTALGIL
jgi:hypothetical protein